MKKLVKVELTKLVKRKVFIILLVLSSWSLIYGLGIFLHWDFISIGARLDLITFVTTMWIFLLMLAIPLLLILYNSSFILGGEIQGGQILLEINRVFKRKSLIIAKYITANLSILFLYLVNVMVSSLVYIVFIAKSRYGFDNYLEFTKGNIESVVVSVINLLFIIFLISIAFYLSLHYSAIVSAFISFGVYIICRLFCYINAVACFIPGYFFIVSDYKLSVGVVVFQFLSNIVLSYLFLILTIKEFENKGF